MTRNPKAKAYRVSFTETFLRHIDVLAIADWQALEIARTLYENSPDFHVSEPFPVDVPEFSVEPLEIGGLS
jgi:hypothetical protein